MACANSSRPAGDGWPSQVRGAGDVTMRSPAAQGSPRVAAEAAANAPNPSATIPRQASGPGSRRSVAWGPPLGRITRGRSRQWLGAVPAAGVRTARHRLPMPVRRYVASLRYARGERPPEARCVSHPMRERSARCGAATGAATRDDDQDRLHREPCIRDPTLISRVSRIGNGASGYRPLVRPITTAALPGRDACSGIGPHGSGAAPWSGGAMRDEATIQVAVAGRRAGWLPRDGQRSGTCLRHGRIVTTFPAASGLAGLATGSPAAT